MSDRPSVETAVATLGYKFDLMEPRYILLTFGMNNGDAHPIALTGEKAGWIRDEIRREQANGSFDPTGKIGDTEFSIRMDRFRDRRAKLPSFSVDRVLEIYRVTDVDLEGNREVLRLKLGTNGGTCFDLWLPDEAVFALADAIDHGIELGLQTE